jgi:hypothetical protein
MFNLEMPGGFAPFTFTIAESRSIIPAHMALPDPPPEYTLTENATRVNRYLPRPQPSQEPPNACNCNICRAPAARPPPPYPFNALEQLKGAGYAGCIAVFVFAAILERHIRFVTHGISKFLLELSHHTLSHGIDVTLGVIVLFCWYLWRAVFCFAAHMSDAIDRFGEELMPDMTSPCGPLVTMERSKFTRYLIQQDKMMRKTKMVSSPVWFEVGTTRA